MLWSALRPHSFSDLLDSFHSELSKVGRCLSLKVGDRYKCLARSSTESLVFCLFLGIHLSVCALHFHKKGALKNQGSLTQQWTLASFLHRWWCLCAVTYCRQQHGTDIFIEYSKYYISVVLSLVFIYTIYANACFFFFFFFQGRWITSWWQDQR